MKRKYFQYFLGCITVNRNRMVWKAGKLQRTAANMLCHKGSESHMSNSVHALERSNINYTLVIKAFNKSLVKTFFSRKQCNLSWNGGNL